MTSYIVERVIFMKKKTIKVVSVICVVALLIGIGGYIAWRNYVPTKIERFGSSVSIINLTDLREVVGYKEYVFVARVIETYDYYTAKNVRKFPDIVNYYDMPFTECRVEIVKNIKGTLKENIETSFYKVGGISISRTEIYLYENDLIPEKDKYYIFMGMAHPDGTMTGGGTNGTIALEDGIDKNNLESSAIYQKYVDAYKNQILSPYSDEISYLATIDVDFGDGTENAKRYALEKESREYSAEYEKALIQGNPKLESALEIN